jgi:L-seryl-tRNA(Ser) seleniumtransferase
MRADLRRLPSVERLTQLVEEQGQDLYPRPLIVACAREVVDTVRERLLNNEAADVDPKTLLAEVQALLGRRTAATLTRAVNATGIIVHTNLGRAPLSERAQAAMAEAARGYSTLEVEADGGRGSRHQHLEPLLSRLTGAQAGIVVNNNAAAVLLALSTLARGKEVVVSRGELVEIGGSFRLPDVMTQSGATLVEVGTTNRTYAKDYERALTPNTSLILKVHRSNFVMDGFVHEASIDDLVDLGRRQGIPVMYDIGSGCLIDLQTRGLPHEPTVPDAIRAGCDIVTFSGDKLLGGPQAGIIVGQTPLLERIRSNPLARAVRIDKLDIAALAATLQAYFDPEKVWDEIPVLRMLASDPDSLRSFAEDVRRQLGSTLPREWQIEVIPTVAEVGGGSIPEAHLPSFALQIRSPIPVNRLDAFLRSHHPPVFGRINEDALLLDVRTLLPGDDDVVVEALTHLSGSK